MFAAGQARDSATGLGAKRYPDEHSGGTAGEYHNELAPFFGPPVKAIDTDPSMRFPHEAWFLPDAYKGRNDYIRETIVQLLVNYNSFVTREILPWRQQENPNIAWDSIKFDRTLVDLEPEQGVPRYVTVEREAHTDYMQRRGLALIVNHGFAATEGGRKDFAYKVSCIANATQETCDQAGINALLRCKNEYTRHLVDMMRQSQSTYDLFTGELRRFGIVQHSTRGWYHLDADAQHVMRLENIQPDTWIVPPRMLAYAAMGQMAETEWYRAGDEARANLMKGEDNFVTFRGKKVFETRPFTLDVDGRTVDPLNRTRMIGDFFVIPYYGPESEDNGKPKGGGDVSTQVYCCDSDRFETFSWANVYEQSRLEGMEGFLGEESAGLEDVKVSLSAAHVGQQFSTAIKTIAGAMAGHTGSQHAMQTDEVAKHPMMESFMDLASETEPVDLHMHQPVIKCEEPPRPKIHPSVSQAVACAIRSAHGVEPDSASHAAATWASSLSREGFADDIARDAMRQALEVSATESIKSAIDVNSDAEMNAHIQTLVASGEDVAKVLHDAHLRGSEQNGPFSRVAEKAARSATAIASAVRVARSGNDLPSDYRSSYVYTEEQIRNLVTKETSKFELNRPYIFKQRCARAFLCSNYVKQSTGVSKQTFQMHEYMGDLPFVLSTALQNRQRNTRLTEEVIEALNTTSGQNHPYSGGVADLLQTLADSSDKAKADERLEKEIRYIEVVREEKDRFVVRSFDVHNKAPTSKYTFPVRDPLYDTTAIARAAKAMNKNFLHEYHVPAFDLLCVRPFRQYTMGTGMLLKRGEELGNTFRGWADFQLTDNIIAKTHIGHFTFWHASVVTNPKCLFLAEDIFCTNYISGEGRGVLSWEHIEDFKRDPLATMQTHNASIIALPVPVGAMNRKDHRLQMNNPISLTGKLDPATQSYCGRGGMDMSIGPYVRDGKKDECLGRAPDMRWNYRRPPEFMDGTALSAAFDQIWGFGHMNHEVDYDNQGVYQTASRTINTTCFHTMQKFLNPTSHRWEVTNLNTGHFGENGIYEGDRKSVV